jgi:hypothetical protein
LKRALTQAKRLSVRHDAMEDALLELTIRRQREGLTATEEAVLQRLWSRHDRLERQTLLAYAQLSRIDPEACARLREGTP